MKQAPENPLIDEIIAAQNGVCKMKQAPDKPLIEEIIAAQKGGSVR